MNSLPAPLKHHNAVLAANAVGAKRELRDRERSSGLQSIALIKLALHKFRRGFWNVESGAVKPRITDGRGHGIALACQNTDRIAEVCVLAVSAKIRGISLVLMQ